MPAWAIFVVSAAAVALAGIRLARDGDAIGHGTGLGGLWVGAILVAGATSLPELVTDISAILQGNPALAVGDLFGSTMANMLILAVADLLTRRGHLLMRVAVNQLLVGVVAVLLTIIAALGILLGGEIRWVPFGWPTLAIALGYAAGMRLLHRNREEPPFRTPEEVAAQQVSKKELQKAVLGFAASAVVILVVAPWLASSTAQLGEQLGFSHGFAGLLLLAAATSLPEMVVTATAVRSGAHGLAVGNLLGSCAFNMAALFLLDLVHGPGSLLAGLDTQLLVAALFGVVLLLLAMLDVMNKAERRRWALEPGPVLMIMVYLLGLVASAGS
ncbi:MAG: sodium:calcium antiporter [Gemmatimonadales bacterium]